MCSHLDDIERFTYIALFMFTHDHWEVNYGPLSVSWSTTKTCLSVGMHEDKRDQCKREIKVDIQWLISKDEA